MEARQTRGRLLPVEVGKRYYSVPHRWIGHVLDVRASASASVVEVFHKGQRIASHPRSHTKLFSTLPEHMPSSHRQHREWSPGRFLNWAKQIGPATLEGQSSVSSRTYHTRSMATADARVC